MDSLSRVSRAARLGRWMGWFPEWFFELPATVKRPVLTLVIFLIVVVPALVFDAATDSTYDAARWVSHSQEVAARVYQTVYDLRDAEAAARTLLIVPGAQVRAKGLSASVDFHAAIDRLPSDLAAVQQLTVDNPSQQERVGRLRASVSGRSRALLEMEKDLQAGHPAEAVAVMVQAISAYPFRDVVREILDEENGLLEQRIAAARREKHEAGLVLVGSVAAQLLLFLTIYLISEKDAARRRSAEEVSAEAAAHAQTIVETNPDPLVVLDGDTRIRSANQAFTTLYEADTARLRGQLLRETGNGAWDLPDVQQRLADLIPRDREIWDLEVTQRIAGDARVMLLNARPFPGAFGKKLILVAAKDVTARKRTEEQITRLNQELALRVEQTHAVNQELEAFSYSVSHDLRAPLRHITGFADMLHNHLGQGAQTEDPKTQRYLKYIRESASQMGTLIDDLLVFSRMGRTEMGSEEVDMTEMAREVIKHFSLETEGRRIDFQVDPLPSIRGDGAMLRLVWMNLIGNAIKYSRQRSEARIEIGTKPSDLPERIYFIRDNGVGFNMKYAHKLFGVFQRLHQADEYEGTGIGLANVRRIVQRHGGKVWAQGYIDQGATFYFSIPLESRATPEIPPTS